MAVKLTGDRAEEKAYFLQLRRSKQITKQQYTREIAKLERAEVVKQKRDEKREEERIVREQAAREVERLERATREAIEKRNEAKTVKELDVSSFTAFTNQGMARIYDWINKTRTANFTLVAQTKEKRGDKFSNVLYRSYTGGKFRPWWNDFTMALRSPDDSKGTLFSSVDNEFDIRTPFFKSRLLLVPFKEAKALKIVSQSFRTGAVHCVFSPLASHWRSAAETVSEKKRKLYLLFASRCDALAVKYDAGISSSDLEKELPSIGITLAYKNILGKVIEELNTDSHSGGGNTRVEFVNSISNHLDVVHYKKPKEISIDEMKEKFSTMKHGAFRWGVKMPCPSWLRTADSEYKVVDKADAVLEEFAESIKLKHMKFDAIENKDLFDFIHHAIEGSTLNIVKDYEGEVYELDKQKAYANFASNPYYEQFQLPAALHHFIDLDIHGEEAYAFMKQRTGFFSGIVYDLPPIATKIAKMIEGENYVLFAPVWCWLIENGASVMLNSGTWGSVCDFRFTQEMMDGKMKRGGSKGVPYYSLFVGRMMSCMKSTNTLVKTDLQMIQHLRGCGYKVRHSSKQQDGLWLGEIEEDKKAAYTAIHVGAAIVQYTFLDSLIEASKYPLDDIVGVNLDAVLLKCPAVESGMFRVKSVKSEKYEKNDSAIFLPCDRAWIRRDTQRIENNTFLRGPGGAGKTFSIMNQNSGYVSPYYTTIAWRQCVSNKEKYGCKTACLHALLGIDGGYKKTQSFESRFAYVPQVIFADEATMWDIPYFVNELKKLYPYALLLVAGHYDTEWRPYQTSEFDYKGKNPIPDFDIVDYTSDYRSKCEVLKQMKVDVESYMQKHYGDTLGLLRWLRDSYSDRVVKKTDVGQLMNQGDWILCSTRSAEDSQIKTWTSFINENRSDINPKYYVANHSHADVLSRSCGGKGLLKGDILDVAVPNRTEERHAYTIHAVQGETITTNVFIDFNKMFDFAQAYTAISRATQYKNVYFVV